MALSPIHKFRRFVLTPLNFVVSGLRCLAGVVVPEVGREAAQVLDGKQGSSQWLQELQPEVQRVTGLLRRPPRLSVILVGDRPDSHLYVQRKVDICEKAIHSLPWTLS